MIDAANVARALRHPGRLVPPGTLPVAAGLVVSGVTAYGFLSVTARALGSARYTPVALLWSFVFVAAPGLFLPLEQEVARALAGRRALGVGGGPVVRRAATAGAVLVAGVVAAVVAAHGPLVGRLFDGNAALLGCLVCAIGAYCVYYLVRGALAGTGRFGRYGTLLALEGGVRVVAASGLWVAGVRSVGAFGLVLGLPCLVALGVTVGCRRQLLRSGPPAPWDELSTALGWLLAGWLSAQLLAYAGVLAVKVLAADVVAGGRFLNALIVARIPLFFFQAVLAALLPRLAGEVAAGRIAELRHHLGQLLVGTAVVVAVATLGYWALGPLAVGLLFGRGYEVGHLDMALLALAIGLYMLALGVAQALLALGGHARVAIAWMASIATFGVAVAVGRGVLLRVEVGLVLASVVACLVMGRFLDARLAAVATLPPVPDDRGFATPAPGA